MTHKKANKNQNQTLLNLCNALLQLNDPETMKSIYCGTHLVGLLSTCTNPVLYAFFNENLRKEFEFVAEFICLNALLRNQSRRSQGKNSPSEPNKVQKEPNGGHQAITREEYIIDDDNIELDPTYHKESEDEADCDCFKTPKECIEMMDV